MYTSNLVPRAHFSFGQHQERELTSGLIQKRPPLIGWQKRVYFSDRKLLYGEKLKYEAMADSHESCGEKCCRCCTAVVNHHICIYGEKGKSDGILIAL